ncbi:MAG: hypothetical protein HZC37_29220 [Burkholderiales bacterium]|nr:hypothetical protein [Burkholderiales bacterium]
MDPLEFLNHLANLFVPALALGAVAAALAKLAWRADLAAQRWWRLAGLAAAANAVVTLAGLALTGRDGRMATYAAMVLATTVTLWWRGFGPGRR